MPRPNLFFSTDIAQALEEAELIFISVNSRPTKRFGKTAGPRRRYQVRGERRPMIAEISAGDKIVVEEEHGVRCAQPQSNHEHTARQSQARRLLPDTLESGISGRGHGDRRPAERRPSPHRRRGVARGPGRHRGALQGLRALDTAQKTSSPPIRGSSELSNWYGYPCCITII
ncbi:unnamed protein product [Trichogramma brassicae]|uniref:Uncharacterized protein n=1 Tax=Trichogramma brassicae TaxID=86971 RepID=A0A6H5J691_9HYME|nr:unnamed protein product [Trichogramma brassicae]